MLYPLQFISFVYDKTPDAKTLATIRSSHCYTNYISIHNVRVGYFKSGPKIYVSFISNNDDFIRRTVLWLVLFAWNKSVQKTSRDNDHEFDKI